MYFLPTPPPDFRTCAKKVFAPGEIHITRRYERSVLILMTKGLLTFREDGKDISVGKGEYYIQKEGLMQEGLTPGISPEYYYIEFNGTFSETNERGTGLPIRGRYQGSVILPVVESFESLFAHHTANQFLLNSYMNRVFGELSSGLSARETDGVLDLIKRDIEARFNENTTLDEIAKRYGYTSDHMIRLFRQKFGVTPHRYRLRLRMEHAKWLIGNTNLPLEAIADAVGYREFPSFWRCYRSVYGISPGRVRPCTRTSLILPAPPSVSCSSNIHRREKLL